VIDKIIEWIGFLLNWGDILDTHDSLVRLINTGLSVTPGVADKIMQGDLDNIDEVIRKAEESPDFSNAQAVPDPKVPQDEKTKEIQNSSAANNTQYQVRTNHSKSCFGC